LFLRFRGFRKLAFQSPDNRGTGVGRKTAPTNAPVLPPGSCAKTLEQKLPGPWAISRKEEDVTSQWMAARTAHPRSFPLPFAECPSSFKTSPRPCRWLSRVPGEQVMGLFPFRMWKISPATATEHDRCPCPGTGVQRRCLMLGPSNGAGAGTISK
jgi:hypothetical protein